ncbi:hypothetical protein VTO73DRAFT_5369 [Trametes versicolor]
MAHVMTAKAVRAGRGGGEVVTTASLMTDRFISYHHLRLDFQGGLSSTLICCKLVSAMTTMAELSRVILVLTTLTCVLLIDATAAQEYAGELTCPSDHQNWYSSCFGETPCKTYVTLRRVCEPNYAPYNLSAHTSSDQCAIGSTECCCNQDAFQLSMLCLNCLHNATSGPDDLSHIDGTSSMYEKYFDKCPRTNVTDPMNGNELVKPTNKTAYAAVESKDFFFVPLTPAANWIYSDIRNRFLQDTAQNKTLCTSDSSLPASPTATNQPSTIASLVSTPGSTTSPGADTAQGDPENNPSPVKRGRSVSAGTIVGIVVAGVLLLGILLGALWYARTQTRKAMSSTSRRDEIQGASGDDKERPRSAGARKAGAYLSGMSITPLLSRRAGSPATNSSIPPSINFYPDAMVRQGNGGRASPRPFSAAYSETLPGYTGWDRKSIGEKSIGEKSAVSERTDSRVQLSTEDSPDPYMPLQPLRLDSKE